MHETGMTVQDVLLHVITGVYMVEVCVKCTSVTMSHLHARQDMGEDGLDA